MDLTNVSLNSSSGNGSGGLSNNTMTISNASDSTVPSDAMSGSTMNTTQMTGGIEQEDAMTGSTMDTTQVTGGIQPDDTLDRSDMVLTPARGRFEEILEQGGNLIQAMLRWRDQGGVPPPAIPRVSQLQIEELDAQEEATVAATSPNKLLEDAQRPDPVLDNRVQVLAANIAKKREREPVEAPGHIGAVFPPPPPMPSALGPKNVVNPTETPRYGIPSYRPPPEYNPFAPIEPARASGIPNIPPPGRVGDPIGGPGDPNYVRNLLREVDEFVGNAPETFEPPRDVQDILGDVDQVLNPTPIGTIMQTGSRPSEAAFDSAVDEFLGIPA